MTFKKNDTPWNKNIKTGYAFWKDKHRSQETKEKISIKLKGHIPWNKGKTNIYSEEALKKMKERALNNPSLSQFRNGHKINLGHYHTEETKEKIRISRLAMRDKISGKNHGNWRGGLSSEIQKRLNAWEWKKIAKKIRKRDKYICQICGKKPSYQVHHIIPHRITKCDNSENLITLCQSCHKRVEHNIEKLIIFLLILRVAECCKFIKKEVKE